MPFRTHLRAITTYNALTLRHTPFAELSGALGDLGTLLPLMIALTVTGAIDLSSTLVFSGLANILTGAVFGIPLPVQPMKAIAAVALRQHFSPAETSAAGLVTAFAVLLLSVTGLLAWLPRVVPVPVVRGIQVGAGLSLAISAGTGMISPLGWVEPAADNRVWALAAFGALVFATWVPRLPYALLVFGVGVVVAGVRLGGGGDEGSGGGNVTSPPAFWHPVFRVPDGDAWRTGAIDAAMPQLPLTTLNSVLAVASLAGSLFPSFPPTPSTTSLGFSVALANLIGCWFGAMPVCHGSGGLAGQYRFGARSGASIIVLGAVKLVLGLFVGDAVVPLLQRFPKSLLGIMVFAAGIELAKVGQDVGEISDLWDQAYEESTDDRSVAKRRQAEEQERRDRWMVMLITAAGCLAFKNDAVGFLAGLVWHWSLTLPGLIERLTGRDRLFRRQREREDEGASLLNANTDGPDGQIA